MKSGQCTAAGQTLTARQACPGKVADLGEGLGGGLSGLLQHALHAHVLLQPEHGDSAPKAGAGEACVDDLGAVSAQNDR